MFHCVVLTNTTHMYVDACKGKGKVYILLFNFPDKCVYVLCMEYFGLDYRWN